MTFVGRSGGVVVYSEQYALTTYPVDLLARYHFATRSSWKPFVGAGAHFLPGPDSPEGSLRSRLALQASVGLDYTITQKLTLRIDARRLLGRDIAYDPALKAFVGMGWRF